MATVCRDFMLVISDDQKYVETKKIKYFLRNWKFNWKFSLRENGGIKQTCDWTNDLTGATSRTLSRKVTSSSTDLAARTYAVSLQNSDRVVKVMYCFCGCGLDADEGTVGSVFKFQVIVSRLKIHRGRWQTSMLVFSGAFCMTCLVLYNCTCFIFWLIGLLLIKYTEDNENISVYISRFILAPTIPYSNHCGYRLLVYLCVKHLGCYSQVCKILLCC